MSLNGKRPAVTKVPITSKKIGRDLTLSHAVGTKCLVQRSPACLGEFLIWFPGVHFFKVDAKELLTFIKYTDGQVQL